MKYPLWPHHVAAKVSARRKSALLKVNPEHERRKSFTSKPLGRILHIGSEMFGLSELPARTEQSDTMSKDLKKLGFNFVGSTICYSFMQAVGMVNDHIVGCFRHAEVKEMAQQGKGEQSNPHSPNRNPHCRLCADA